MITRRNFAAIAAASVLAPALVGRAAFAQAWPTRFVRFVVPFSGGRGSGHRLPRAHRAALGNVGAAGHGREQAGRQRQRRYRSRRAPPPTGTRC
jgi:hypothetical protein